VEGPPDQGPAGVALSEQLARLLKVLRRRWPVLVAVPALAGVVSLIIGLSEQKKYDATAKLVVNPTNQVTALLNPGAAGQSADPERDLNTEVSLITTVPLAEAVRHQLKLTEPRDQLLAQVTTSIEGTTNIVDITVRDPSPARGARIANAFATQYVAARDRQARSAFDQAAGQARAQLGSLTPAQRKSAAGLQLRSRLQELVVDGALQTGNAHVIQPAATPTSAATPRLKFDTALGVILGLILGLVVVGVLDLLDRRVKDDEEVSTLTGLPALGAIPKLRRSRGLGPLDHGPEVTEGYRSLATSLRFFKLGDQVKTLMITSPGPLAGKTSVTLSLAGALAEFGQKVIAVECDLRRPRFTEYARVAPNAGLSSVLAGLANWEDEIVEVDAARTLRGASTAQNGSAQFSVLPAGPTPPNPLALLSSPEMSELLTELRASADVLLVDTPPIGSLGDAVALVPWVDGVALVVRRHHTTRDALTKARATLEELHAPVLGTVLTAGPASLGGYYYSDQAPRRVRVESTNGRPPGSRTRRPPTPRA
jgi:capsular exopolysaccharide synthesis family protein